MSIPVIFSPYLEKLQNRNDDEDHPVRRRERERTAEPERERDGERPVGQRVALGLLTAGALGAVVLYLRRVAGSNDAPDATSSE